MAGNVPASILKDLHGIVASCHDALEHAVDGDLRRVRTGLVEAQITLQSVLEEATVLLRAEDLARLHDASAVSQAS